MGDRGIVVTTGYDQQTCSRLVRSLSAPDGHNTSS